MTKAEMSEIKLAMSAGLAEVMHEPMTIKDAARYMQVGKSTVMRYIDSGQLRCYDLPVVEGEGKRVRKRIDKSDLNAFIFKKPSVTKAEIDECLDGRAEEILRSIGFEGRRGKRC